jgi:hypothetical protein
MTYSHLPDRAISIRQPWAWAILNAGKDIENRPRRWSYRGPICIHASLYQIDEGLRSYSCLREDFLDHRQTPPPYPDLDALQRGGIIGTAEIVDCVEDSDSPWFFGRYGLVLRNVQPVPFIPVKGALGPFMWRDRL